MKTTTALFLLLILLPPAPQVASSAEDGTLVRNPGFEGRGKNGLPPGWEAFSIGPAAEFAADTDVRHGGRQSGRVRFTADKLAT